MHWNGRPCPLSFEATRGLFALYRDKLACATTSYRIELVTAPFRLSRRGARELVVAIKLSLVHEPEAAALIDGLMEELAVILSACCLRSKG
ncbi:hypothetical protein WME94_21135 [Sorangium sp. So ce429]